MIQVWDHPNCASEIYGAVCQCVLEWKEIYNLPFKVLEGTKSREFQYKILHRYLTTNAFLHKIGLIASSLCTFCGAERESLEHLLITCPFTNDFWLDFICWCRNVNIAVDGLSNIDKLFGIWNREEDFLLLNHLLIVAKKCIYECRKNSTRQSFRVFCKTLAYVYQLESQVMKSNNKESSHNLKWKKYIDKNVKYSIFHSTM